MKVLLIYPGIVDGFNSCQTGANWFNHGVGIISSLLKQAGHRVEYLDCRKLSSWEEVKKFIDQTEFEVALLSIATVDFSAGERIAGLIKKKNAALPVIVGGPHATLMTEQTAAVPVFDYIFTHEAEVTLLPMLGNLRSYPRIIRGEMPGDLDTLPFVDRSIAPHGETTGLWNLPRPYFTITASRGCLYNCSFCQPAERAVFGDKVRRRSISNVLNELQFLSSDYRMKSFMIHDDCFTQYGDWVKDFCADKQKHELTQPFVCQSRADIICKNPDLMQRLKKAGLAWVYIGFESGSDRILKFIRKGVTVSQNLEAARICRALGIKIFANYMFGLPGETAEEMEQTAVMMRKIKPDMYSPSVFTPAPGSDLYEYCCGQGINLVSAPEDYRRNADSGIKIKGVDYQLVKKMVAESQRLALLSRVRRRFLRTWEELLVKIKSEGAGFES